MAPMSAPAAKAFSLPVSENGKVRLHLNSGRRHRIRPGDIVVLDVPGHSLLAHRVISATTASGTVEITTQGDANPQADPSVTVDADREIAVVLFRVPGAGYVANFFMQPAVLTAGLGLLLLGNVLTVVLVLYPRSTADRGTWKGGGE